MPDMPEHAALAAEAAIRRTLARYCHAIDDGDLAALAGCFAPGAELEAFGRTRSGREAVTALLAKAMPPESRGKHLTVNTVIGAMGAGGDGVTRASVLSDFAFVARDGSLTTGRYSDTFVLVGQDWLIGRREIRIGG